MSSNKPKYIWLLLIAYVMMAMHSFTPHVHHDHTDKHAMHDHGHEHGHDHENDGDDNHTTDLENGFTHFLHNGGDYELFNRDHSSPIIKELLFTDNLISVFNFNTLSLPVNDLPPPGWTPDKSIPVIFLSPCGLRAPPSAFPA
jgi:hypothetical protein